MCLPHPHQAFCHIWADDHPVAHSTTQCHHDAFSKPYVRGVLERTDLEDFTIYETLHVNLTHFFSLYILIIVGWGYTVVFAKVLTMYQLYI
jgi:hypothetical protein